MALDFHRLDNNEYVFGLNDQKYKHLEIVFNDFKQQTGIYIDPYGDTILTVQYQKMLEKIIDNYIIKEDLNNNKQKTIDIIAFKTLLDYLSNKNIDLKIMGD